MKFPNKKYVSSSVFYSDYLMKLSSILKKRDFINLSNITKFLEKKIKLKKNIFVCGNGGSASIANHFLCDFNKGVKVFTDQKVIPRIISLTNSIELITAISNDISYNQIFSSQLENLSKKNDCIILLSCSGKSKNIINAARYAIKKKIDIISFVGFGKNEFLKKNSKFIVNLQIKNYGIAEDIFQIIMHMISQYIKQKFVKKTKKHILY